MINKETFYQTQRWRRCRNAFVSKSDGLCERCKNNNKYVEGKIVHHKIYLNDSNVNDAKISLNHEMLELLCQDCHNKEHFQVYEPTREDVMFDENGYIVERK